MPKIDCSCRGVSPDCPRCYGKGEYNTEDLENARKKMVRYISIYKPAEAQRVEKKAEKVQKEYRSNEQFLKELTHSKKLMLVDKIVSKIDDLSEQQAQILRGSKKPSARISENIMRRLSLIESQKSEWKLKIRLIQDSEIKGGVINVVYKHKLSRLWHDFSKLSEIVKLRKEAILMNKSMSRSRDREASKLKKQRKQDEKRKNFLNSASGKPNTTQSKEVKKTRKERYKEGKKFRPSNGNTLGDFFERDKWKRGEE